MTIKQQTNRNRCVLCAKEKAESYNLVFFCTFLTTFTIMSTSKRQKPSRLLRLPDSLLALVMSFHRLPYVFDQGSLICRHITRVIKQNVQLATPPDLYLSDTISCVPTWHPGIWHSDKHSILSRITYLWARGYRKCNTLAIYSRSCYEKAYHEMAKKMQVKNVILRASTHSLRVHKGSSEPFSMGDHLESFVSYGSIEEEALLAATQDSHATLKHLGLSQLPPISLAPKLTSFTFLNTQTNWVAQHSLFFATHCRQLTSLDITSDETDVFCQPSIQALSSLVHLESVTLCAYFVEYKLTPQEQGLIDFQPLSAWTRLKKADLRTWPFRAKHALSFLPTTLETLVLNESQSIVVPRNRSNAHTHLDEILVHCSQLKTLVADVQVDDIPFQSETLLPAHLESVTLRLRYLGGRNEPTGKACCLDARVMHRLATWPALRHLEYTPWRKSKDPGLQIGTLNPNLHSLRLNELQLDAHWFGKTNLFQLSKLRSLALCGNLERSPMTIRDEDVCAILLWLTQLRSLELVSDAITLTSFRHMLSAPHLQYIRVKTPDLEHDEIRDLLRGKHLTYDLFE